jgi:hypothetical protein
VIYTALAQGNDPLKILDDFQKLAPGALSNYLAGFLNINRSPTSVLAVRTTKVNNPYIARSIMV